MVPPCYPALSETLVYIPFVGVGALLFYTEYCLLYPLSPAILAISPLPHCHPTRSPLTLLSPSLTPSPPPVSSLNYGRDDPTLKGIHDDMKSFLQEEQDSMEDRIKKFEEGQRMVYAELQARAHRERSIIFR